MWFWDYCIITSTYLAFIIMGRWICAINICLDTVFCQYSMASVTKLNKSISYICLCNRKETWDVNSILLLISNASSDSHDNNWFRWCWQLRMTGYHRHCTRDSDSHHCTSLFKEDRNWHITRKCKNELWSISGKLIQTFRWHQIASNNPFVSSRLLDEVLQGTILNCRLSKQLPKCSQ